MSQATGVKVSFGVNAYYVNPDPSTVFSVLIDPSYLNGDAEHAPFISLVTIRWKSHTRKREEEDSLGSRAQSK